jgi:RNA polymerase sigma factor (sigma-70 family)
MFAIELEGVMPRLAKKCSKGPLILRKGPLLDRLLADAEVLCGASGRLVASIAARRERLRDILGDFRLSQEEMEDTLQDVFVVALRNLDTIRDFEGFLVALSYRICIQQKRRIKRSRENPLAPEVWEELGERWFEEERPEQTLDLQKLLGRLSTNERIVLRMRLCGFDNQEIGSSLRLSPDSIRRIWGRGVERLQKMFG